MSINIILLYYAPWATMHCCWSALLPTRSPRSWLSFNLDLLQGTALIFIHNIWVVFKLSGTFISVLGKYLRKVQEDIGLCSCRIMILSTLTPVVGHLLNRQWPNHNIEWLLSGLIITTTLTSCNSILSSWKSFTRSYTSRGKSSSNDVICEISHESKRGKKQLREDNS